MELICTALRGNQHLASRGYVARNVLGRTIELKLTNRSLRDVEDRGADRLVGNVLPVEKNAGRAPRDATDRQG